MTAIPNVPTTQTGRSIRLGRPSANTMLWGAQIALGALFVFAGAFKLVMPAADLGENTALPVAFMRFIGACELLGGIGLVTPAAVRFSPFARVVRALAPVAAAGLVIIMGGAVVVSAVEIGAYAIVTPLVVGLACAAVVRGRRSWITA